MQRLKIENVSALCLCFWILMLVGCSEDNNSAGPDIDKELLGYWSLNEMESHSEEESQLLTESILDSMGLIWTLEMKADGSAEQTTNISGPLTVMPGTWKVSENHLSLQLLGPSGETGTIAYNYFIENNVLNLNWEIPSGTELFAKFINQ